MEQGREHGTQRAVVSIPSSAPGAFHIYGEDVFTELVKTTGLASEFQIGDTMLDLKYYFSGSSNEFLKALFDVRENVEALRGLFALGFDELKKDGDRLIACKTVKVPPAPEEVGKAAEQLGRFRFPASMPATQHRRLSDMQAVSALLGASGIVALAGWRGFQVASPLVDGWAGFFGMAAALVAAALAGAYFLLKGRPMLDPGWTVVTAMLMVAFLTPGVAGVLALANERLDQSEAQEVQVRLVDRITHTTRGSVSGRNYYFLLESWRGDLREHIEVSEQVYSLAPPGTIWRLRVRSGLLGKAWIESMRPIR
jgi:hypothetical protein